jgi:hypothetical protein
MLRNDWSAPWNHPYLLGKTQMVVEKLPGLTHNRVVKSRQMNCNKIVEKTCIIKYLTYL